jgi:hypothetical protein
MDFGIDAEDYLRFISRCDNCDVYNNYHDYDSDNLYSELYNQATYSNSIKDNYDRIMGVPYSNSDNKQRVERIIKYYHKNNKPLNDVDV